MVTSAAALLLGGAATNVLGASPGGVRLAGSSPSWVSGARSLGAPAAASRISFSVVLPLRNANVAAKLATQVSNPKSPAYGHYLSAQAFNDQFGPTAATVAKVTGYLKTSGFKVSSVAQGNRWVDASGTVAQIESTFKTTLLNYSHQGQTLRESTDSLSVPSAIADSISGVIGISQTPVHVPNFVTPRDAQPAPSLCSSTWAAHTQTAPAAYGHTSFPTPNCGYTPTQLRTAYGVQSAVSHGNTGRGVTVAIIDAYASPTMLADANQLSTLNGEPTFTTGQYTETVFGPFDDQAECGGELGWNEEESLDVEAVHGMAPGAAIHYIGAADCDTGIDSALNYVLQNHVASLVSNSYGFAGEDGLGSEVTLEHSMFVQAALEGIGLYYSTGDDGDNVPIGAPHPEPDYPSSDPLVTAVGGTDLALNSSNGYLFETAWGDDLDSVNFATSPSSYAAPLPGSFIFGGGGGVSALFAEPLYQKLDVPSSLARLNGPNPMRVVPDVATDGDPETGYLIDIQGSLVQIGGTSLSAPLFTGIQALASQGRFFSIGFANPLLYLLGAAHIGFHDVVAPSSTLAMVTVSGRSLLTMNQDTSLTSTRGYDDTTGLGSPNGPALLIAEKLLP